ncbi:Uncharacterized protein TCM_007878 [Theobroma cacao]|uniref:Uncharacterized protein n=1 Tax=Theobroma cacao TaxID=3641 RepID=A0A061EAI2_THECC|nr:Uncharacterized protein TCM_007878 [Theobroma cacao]
MPDYCTHCCHVGHDISGCLVIGNKQEKPGMPMPKPTEAVKTNEPSRIPIRENHEEKNFKVHGGKEKAVIVNNGKRKEAMWTVPLKQSRQWKEVGKASKTGAKISLGVEIVSENSSKNPQVEVSNRFNVIATEGKNEEQSMGKERNRVQEVKNSLVLKNQFGGMQKERNVTEK